MSEKSTLTITDNRTGKTYELPVENGTIRALDLRRIKADEHDFGLMTYDPAFTNTASCKSAITFIDGDKGILEYRGYPIEELAEKSTFLEVAWLLLKGELPTAAELKEFTHHVSIHTYLHENLKKLMEGFRHDAHPAPSTPDEGRFVPGTLVAGRYRIISLLGRGGMGEEIGRASGRERVESS